MREPDEMKGFAGIVGHRDVVEHIQNAIKENKVSHAYIFSGEKGSGKRLMATLFAMTLQCEKHGINPCGQCSSCRKALSGNHPDIIYVQHEKPNSIGIDEVREQLVNDAGIRPYESRYKIYIIEEASKMTVQAQNAILKTIEEPPEYVVIMLLADNMEALLPTIRSRCVNLSLRPVSDSDMKEYLMKQMHLPDYQAEIGTAFAQGNLGRAKQIAESPDFMNTVNNAVRLMKKSKELDVSDMIDAVRNLTKDRDEVHEYLEVFDMWFRDVLLFKATCDVDGLLFREEINAIQERANVSSYEGIEKIQKAIRTAGDRLRANVSFELTMELLFLTIKEN